MDAGELVHLRRARDLIDREYARPLNVPAMARAAAMSPSHFARRCREAYGETPYQHLLTRRIRLMAIGPPIPPADQDTVRDLVSKGSLGGVIFETDDCRAAFEQVRAKGAGVLQEPIEQPYGVIDCAFRDPSGNMIRFSERQPPR